MSHPRSPLAIQRRMERELCFVCEQHEMLSGHEAIRLVRVSIDGRQTPRWSFEMAKPWLSVESLSIAKTTMFKAFPIYLVCRFLGGCSRISPNQSRNKNCSFSSHQALSSFKDCFISVITKSLVVRFSTIRLLLLFHRDGDKTTQGFCRSARNVTVFLVLSGCGTMATR